MTAKTILGCCAVALSLVGVTCAAEVRRVILPERLTRGNAAVEPVSPIDAAAWISVADDSLPPGGLFLRFRRAFSADGSTLRFHVSADERFILLLDGEVIARGPDRGDPNLWFFQSYETQPGPGEHVLEAVVWKLNPGQAPNAQMSWRLGFVLAAEGHYSDALTTGIAAWEVGRLTGTEMTRAKYPMNFVGAQCAVRGTGLLDERPSVWEKPVVVRAPIVSDGYGAERKSGWLMYPSQLPAQVARSIRPGRCVAVDAQAFVTNGYYSAAARDWGSNAVYRAESGCDPRRDAFDALLKDGRALTIPPHTRIRFLWNLGDYFCAYPELETAGGRGATVAWGWAESLYLGDCFDWHTVVTDKVRKGLGNRNDFAGKYFYGMTDVYRPDGRGKGRFTTPWWRCGLYCQLEVATDEEPMVLTRIGLSETRYPFDPEAYFRCDDESLEAIGRLCQRGLQMCMHETHMDCPYYEQQMYGGDTRLQLLMSQVLSPDDALNRQALRLFEVSQRDSGLVSMDHPTACLVESTSFSQYWAMMHGDYALRRNNPTWLRARMPSVRKLLFALEDLVGPTGLQRGAPGWHFVDWVPEWPKGTAPGHEAGESSVDSLLYLLTLRKAIVAEEALGETELAARWRRRAEMLAARIRESFWCEARGLLADTPARKSFSEHAQALAILSDAFTAEQAARATEALSADEDLTRCTVSFSSYLFEAYFKMGRADLFLRKLGPWRDYVKMGLRTPLEGPGDARSDCHAWSSNPIYHFHTGLAGVNPAGPGFESVRIAPCPGPLSRIEAKTATPHGYVLTDLRFADGRVTGTIVLPPGLSGEFVWRDRRQNLNPGRNECH